MLYNLFFLRSNIEIVNPSNTNCPNDQQSGVEWFRERAEARKPLQDSLLHHIPRIEFPFNNFNWTITYQASVRQFETSHISLANSTVEPSFPLTIKLEILHDQIHLIFTSELNQWRNCYSLIANYAQFFVSRRICKIMHELVNLVGTMWFAKDQSGQGQCLWKTWSWTHFLVFKES